MIARMRSYLFTASSSTSDGVFCATCHEEHLGQSVNLRAVADTRCQACHVVQFDDFENGHPPYRSYPFRRRTRIQFDHTQHFGKNFADAVSRKRNTGKVPEQCTDCHVPTRDKLHMAVKPFDQTCASCHLRQILGEERASGPKGITFFALPGLDIQTLREKQLDIGDWPQESEAEISPLMAMLIGVDERRRQLLRFVSGIDLLDLSKANRRQLEAVAAFAREVKLLLHDLITSKTSRLRDRVNKATGTKISRKRMSQLIGALPRDVLLNLQQQWLPNLAVEIEGAASDQGWSVTTAAKPEPKKSKPKPKPKPKAKPKPVSVPVNVDPNATPRRTAENDPEESASYRVTPFGELVNANTPPSQRPTEEDSEEQADNQAEENQETAEAEQEEEQDEPERPRQPAVLAKAVDSETWAEFGGWYRREHAILYRPRRHKDEFFQAWLDVTSRARSKSASVAALIKPAFEHLADKDAQGQCTKCHSVDDARGNSRLINWNPATYQAKGSRFTRFVHETHFGVIGEKGCLGCHTTAKTPATKEFYKSGNPLKFVSNFKPIDKATCDGCHNKTGAPQTCTLCHNYHVTKVESPDIKTAIPKN